MKKKILVTGVAGFIGFHVTKKLLKEKFKIVGIDNLNSYYDVNLKRKRLKNLKNKNFIFYKSNISNSKKLEEIFKKHKFDLVINLAAQAGIRYSLINPRDYLNSNANGFFNIIDCCKKYNIKTLLYASSSSVYGNIKKFPYSLNNKVDKPLQFYAATKIFNEITAYCYSHLYKFKTVGLRFFTVYGPWGRPDMALFSFAKKIINGETIEIFNKGNHSRDFTYIDDVVDLIYRIVDLNIKNKNQKQKHEIYNIGGGKATKLIKFISLLEKHLNIKAKKKYIKKQPGDMDKTLADIKKTKKVFKYKPKVKPDEGIKNFVNWYRNYTS